jgi:hypothetical protein
LNCHCQRIPRYPQEEETKQINKPPETKQTQNKKKKQKQQKQQQQQQQLSKQQNGARVSFISSSGKQTNKQKQKEKPQNYLFIYLYFFQKMHKENRINSPIRVTCLGFKDF